MPKIAGSPANNKVMRTPRTPKTVPKKSALAASQMSPMAEIAASLPPKARTRRNTMAVDALNGEQSKTIRRSARVAMKSEWVCEDMPPPSTPLASATKRAMPVKKSTAKKSVRKTLVCGDDEENFDKTDVPSDAPRKNYVSLLVKSPPSPTIEETGEIAASEASFLPEHTEVAKESECEKKNGTFDLSDENEKDLSAVDLLTDDENENLPSVSLLGAKLKASKIQSSDSETDTSLPSGSILGAKSKASKNRLQDSETDLPSVSILGATPTANKVQLLETKNSSSFSILAASDSETENVSAVTKNKRASKVYSSISAQNKTRSTRKSLASEGAGDITSNDGSNTLPFKIPLLETSPPHTVADDTAQNEKSLLPVETVGKSNEENKDGTFEVLQENSNDVSGVNMLTEDESDVDEDPNMKTKTVETANPDSELEPLPSVSMIGTLRNKMASIEQSVDKRISIVDLTDSPAMKSNSPIREANRNTAGPVTPKEIKIKINDVTFSPKVPSVSAKPSTSKWLTLPPAGTSKNSRNPSPMKVQTPFKRKSPRMSNGASKKQLTSAKKKCLLSMAKEAIADRAASKQVAFNSPHKFRLNTPARALSMGIKKTPYRMQAEATTSKAVKATDENGEPKTSIVGPKTPGKVPNFGKMHQKLFANMESLDTAVVRVDERAKELLSGRKLPAVAKIVKPVVSGSVGARRALQPQQNINRSGIPKAVVPAIESKLHKVTKTINREDRRKQMFKAAPKTNDSAKGRVARTGILKGVRTNRRFELMMQSRELANNQ